MAREFRLPDIGEGLTEAEIVRWHVAAGDEVEADQVIVEVETDKAVVEIPSPYAGVVVSLGGAEGEVIEVGEVLVTIGEPGEMSPDEDPEPDATSETSPSSFQAAPIVGSISSEAESLTQQPDATETAPQSVKALPVVRKLARDNDVALETITGTGPGGRITRSDVEAAIAAGDSEPEPAAHHDEAVEHVAVGAGHGVAWYDEEEETLTEQTPEWESESETKVEAESVGEAEAESEDHERRPMSRLRRTIAANMAKSWAEIPHVTTFEDVDATRILEVRRALGQRHGDKIPLEALVVKAVLPALDEFPEFNASIDGDDLVLHRSRDIGIAVDTPGGLMVAVIRNAGEMSVLELAAEIRRLGAGARERTLSPDELTGQTFTVSNIGAVGGGHGTPIVPYGTVAILSIGAARLRPVVFDEDLAIAPVMPLSLSYDHRVIDGAVGRRFTALLMENLAEPALFLAS